MQTIPIILRIWLQDAQQPSWPQPDGPWEAVSCVCIFACWEDTFAQWHKRHNLTDTRKGQEERTSLSTGLQHLTSPERRQAVEAPRQLQHLKKLHRLLSKVPLEVTTFYPFILKNLKTMLSNIPRKSTRIMPWKQIWRGVGAVGARSGHTQMTFGGIT